MRNRRSASACWQSSCVWTTLMQCSLLAALAATCTTAQAAAGAPSAASALLHARSAGSAEGSSGSAVDVAHSAPPRSRPGTDKAIDCSTPSCSIYTVARAPQRSSAGPLDVLRYDVAQPFVGYSQRQLCLQADASDITQPARVVPELAVPPGEEAVFQTSEPAYVYDEGAGTATVCACGSCVNRRVSSCTVYTRQPADADEVLLPDTAQCTPAQAAALRFDATAPPLLGSEAAVIPPAASGHARHRAAMMLASAAASTVIALL